MSTWKVGWGVTRRCNMKCPFCYSSAARAEGDEADLRAMIRFIDTNHAFIDSINYGTGENTLSENWFSLVKYVHQTYPAIAQALTTNGFLAPALAHRPDRSKILEALDEVDVSLDFFDVKKHNEFRGHPQASQWVRDTVRLCKEACIETTLVVIGVDQTLQLPNLERIFDYASGNGCYVRVNIFRPNHQQKLPPLSYRVLQKCLSYVVRNHEIVSLCDPLISAIVIGKTVQDGSGTTSLRILPDGSITPATYLVSDEWRRAHISTAFLGNGELVDTLSANIRDVVPSECHECAHGERCRGGAIDRRIIWYGTVKERDPYCPQRHGDDFTSWRFSDNPTYRRGPTVHDGYLPTMIFSPRAVNGGRRQKYRPS